MSNSQKPIPSRRRAGRAGGAVATGILLVIIAALGSHAAATAPGAARTATVEIANFKFAPPDLTVTVGTTVIWKNSDDSPHRIADSSGAYASPALDTEGSFSRTFGAPGVYNYICSLHPYMKGRIVVNPAGTGS